MAELEGTDATESGLNRRQALARLGIAGAAVAAAPAFLAACGGDNKSSSSNTTAAASGGGSATTAASGSATTSGGAGTTAAGGGGDVGPQLLKALGLSASDNLGGGQQWKMGAVLALSGNGSFYGKTMSRGIDLAVKHIAAAGGPTISVGYKDHKSGDPQAGVNAVTELGTSGYPAKLASYGDDIGAMIPGTQQYKIFTFDGGGGTGTTYQKEDYFYGCRAITPDDTYPGLFQWLKQTYPNAKTTGFVGWDLGATNNDAVKAGYQKASSNIGFQPTGVYELVAPNTSDFAQVLPKVKSNEPDILLAFLYGQDPGAFLNQAQGYGLKAAIVGFEFTPDGLNASRGAYEKGWTFTFDYFDAPGAVSPLGKLFVSEFKKAYGEDPDFYAANYYEDTLGMWDVIRRTLKAGGNINSGTDLQTNFKTNTTLVSVYGGDATTNGTLKIDPVTHTVTQRLMGVFTYKNGKVTPRALFDLGGAGFKIVNA
jgi:branched-chain amino acid transport system substrate-binding protein